jgi:hypothetical protein
MTQEGDSLTGGTNEGRRSTASWMARSENNGLRP